MRTLVAQEAGGAVMPGLFESWLIVVLVLLFGLWLWALVDALRFDDEVWRAARQTKPLMVALIVVLGFLGALLYAAIARPALSRARRSGEAT